MNNYNYNAGYNGYNQPYVQDTYVQETVNVENYGGNPYYQQPMIVQPQPQVVVVEDRYNNN